MEWIENISGKTEKDRLTEMPWANVRLRLGLILLQSVYCPQEGGPLGWLNGMWRKFQMAVSNCEPQGTCYCALTTRTRQHLFSFLTMSKLLNKEMRNRNRELQNGGNLKTVHSLPSPITDA